jgi:hypothetical protein
MSRLFPVFTLLALGALPALAEGLRAGAAAVKITPPVGIPMAGYYSLRPAEAVHDDLFARALALESDGAKAAIVSLDVIHVPRQVVEAAREEIARDPGIPAEAVMISATHDHTGPVLSGRGGVIEELYGGTTEPCRKYTAELPGKIAEAVRAAWAARVPAAVSAGAGHEASLMFNRRYHMKDGTVAWNPGKMNPNIVRPAGPIDPEVPVVCFADEKKRPVAVCVNYAVHLDNIGGPEISADVPGVVARHLAEALGPQVEIGRAHV